MKLGRNAKACVSVSGHNLSVVSCVTGNLVTAIGRGRKGQGGKKKKREKSDASCRSVGRSVVVLIREWVYDTSTGITTTAAK